MTIEDLDEMIEDYEDTAMESGDKYQLLCDILKGALELVDLPWQGEREGDTRCRRHYVMYYVQHMFEIPPKRLERLDTMVGQRVKFLFEKTVDTLSNIASAQVLLKFLDTHLAWLNGLVGSYFDDRVNTTVPRAKIAEDVINSAELVGKMYAKNMYPEFRRSLKWAMLDRIKRIEAQPLQGESLRSSEDQRRQATVVLLFIYSELTEL